MEIYAASKVLTCAGGGKPKKGKALQDTGLFAPGALAVKNGKILAVGERDALLSRYQKQAEGIYQFKDNLIMPGLVDCHTHPLFAGSRVDELLLRLSGLDYLSIQKQGGGISRTVKACREAGDSQLLKAAAKVLKRMLKTGTTSLEVKSGYGLSLKEELRQLKLLNRLKELLPQDIVVTFLGAHSLPAEYRAKRKDYVDLVIKQMLPLAKGKAEFVDVFCEKGAFNLEESSRILKAARTLGFKLKIHAEEFSHLGGTALGISLRAASVEHLQFINRAEIKALADSETIAVLLPLTSLFLGADKFAPAREIVDSGGTIALGTDYNAGSCFSESLPAAIAFACLKMKLSPEEAINAATINSAFALGRGESLGSLEKGKQADFLVLEISDYREFPFHLGVNLVKQVYKKGKRVA